MARLAVGLVLVALVILAMVFRSNWLRGPVGALLSASLHRPVAIVGDLQLRPWSWRPSAVLNDVRMDNPSAQGGGEMARVPRIVIKASLVEAFAGRPAITFVEVDRPVVRFVGQADGRANWVFGPPGQHKAPLAIDHLVILGGVVSLDDARTRSHFAGTAETDETRAGAGVATIDGHLRVDGQAWAGTTPVVLAPRLLVKTSLLSLMAGKLFLPLIEADHPDVHLLRALDGRANWDPVPGGHPSKATAFPSIGRIVVTNGDMRFEDVKRRLNFVGVVEANETSGPGGSGRFRLAGRGTLNAAPFTATLEGGPLIAVDPRRPYEFTASLTEGATRVEASGSITHPFDLDQVSGRLHVSGADFADLYHLTGLALPNTPPYDLSANFTRAQTRYALAGIQGRMGDSDMNGAMSIDTVAGRPLVQADLSSKRLRLADLAAVLGGVPKTLAGHTVSAAQKITAARLKSENRILPDARLDPMRVRAMDAKVSYRALSVDAGAMPVRGLSLQLSLDHGFLSVKPLEMTLPQGRLAGGFSIDARPAVPVVALDLALSNGRLEDMARPVKGGPPPIEGGLYARAQLTGNGDSVHAAAATANGAVSVVIAHGEMRQAFAELLGIDATKGLFLLFTANKAETPIRCAVADFGTQAGVMSARRIVLDTGVVQSVGSGRIDLRDETLDLRLTGKPKRFRLVHIGAPITLTGHLATPKVGVDVAKAAPQLAVGAAVGVFLAPLAAVLPFVNPGLAKDADCSALVASEADHAAPVKVQRK